MTWQLTIISLLPLKTLTSKKTLRLLNTPHPGGGGDDDPNKTDPIPNTDAEREAAAAAAAIAKIKAELIAKAERAAKVAEQAAELSRQAQLAFKEAENVNHNDFHLSGNVPEPAVIPRVAKTASE